MHLFFNKNIYIYIFLEYFEIKPKDCIDKNVLNSTMKMKIVVQIVQAMPFIHIIWMIHNDLKFSILLISRKSFLFTIYKFSICLTFSILTIISTLNLIHWFNIILMLTFRYNSIERAIINSLNTVNIEFLFNHFKFNTYQACWCNE